MSITQIKNAEKIREALSAKRSLVDFFPKEIDIEITSFCNYRCSMCPHALVGNSCASYMLLSDLKKLSFLFPYCKRIMLQGDGEPLMHPELVDIIKYLRSFGCQLCTTTNLSLLTKKMAEVLSNEFEVVTVSCDAGNKEKYEMIRKNGDFNKFCSNLELLMKSSDSNKIIVNAVIMKQNIDCLDELLEFLCSFGIHNVVFSNLLTTSFLKNTADSVNLMGDYAIKKLNQAKEKAKSLEMCLTINWNYAEIHSMKEMDISIQNCKRIFTEEEIKKFSEEYQQLRSINRDFVLKKGQYKCYGICRNIFEKTYIDVHGNITLCCYGKLQPIGNIFKQNFWKTWNERIYQECRQAFFEGELPDFCIGCRYAMAANCQHMQAYPFRILSLDHRFMDDKEFWDNR